jgi:uncharacterized protein YjeT (DUF2065 family)
MTETKHIARGTDLTLIVAGVLIVLAAGAWYRYGTGSYTPAMIVLAIFGGACVLAGAAIIAVAVAGAAITAAADRR